jgi:hypothetical protein
MSYVPVTTQEEVHTVGHWQQDIAAGLLEGTVECYLREDIAGYLLEGTVGLRVGSTAVDYSL